MEKNVLPENLFYWCERSLLRCLDTSNLAEDVRSHPQRRFLVAGLVDGVEIFHTRRGGMAVVKLIAGCADVQVNIFSGEFLKYQSHLQDGKILGVTGARALEYDSCRICLTAYEIVEIDGTHQRLEHLLKQFEIGRTL